MLIKQSWLALFAILLLGGQALAQKSGNDQAEAEKEAERMTQQIEQALEIGGGPFLVKKTEDGEIVSAAFVGQNRISTVLGASKGKETAKTRAILKAKGAFVQWLKEEVTVMQSADDETIIMLAGAENDDGSESLNESGKSVEQNSELYKSFANGIVRGMKPIGYDIHVDRDTKESEYRVVLYWSKADSDAVKKLKKDLDSDDVAPEITKKREINKTIKPKRIIIIP
jgi:hypothetical protein